jgi:hypothetical protein
MILSEDQNTLILDGVKYRAQPVPHGCVGCDILDRNRCDHTDLPCAKIDRKDNQPIIWKEVK